MLLVKTKIGPSMINGTGLFADEFIPKGARFWEYIPDFDISLADSDLEQLPAPKQEYWKHYAYKSINIGKWILCGDDTRFMNHSKNPNIENLVEKKNGEPVAFAARDICKNEELTVDYFSFDSDAEFKIR